MSRKFEGKELVIATHNKGKLKEIGELLEGRAEKLYAASDFGLEAPAETGTTFLENATIKALFTAKATGKPALADDSGLCVDALDGAPGVYSADWAEDPGKPRDFYMAMGKVEKLVGNHSNRKAHFVSCLVLAWPDGHTESFEGHAHGEVVFPPRGTNGFGYDPIFRPNGAELTYGEMNQDEKNATNHRAVAFKGIVQKCFR
jgi:XTP/dITP diphosphohydrolase